MRLAPRRCRAVGVLCALGFVARQCERHLDLRARVCVRHVHKQEVNRYLSTIHDASASRGGTSCSCALPTQLWGIIPRCCHRSVVVRVTQCTRLVVSGGGIPGLHLVTTACAVIGVIKLVSGFYLYLVTARKLLGCIGPHQVFAPTVCCRHGHTYSLVRSTVTPVCSCLGFWLFCMVFSPPS